jgi:hypothetical protein
MITKGVQNGEKVVTAGQIKLDNGAHIAISDDKTLAEKNSQPRLIKEPWLLPTRSSVARCSPPWSAC